MATQANYAGEAAEASGVSGVSWAAIFAGAFAAAALSFILVMLGFGLGFSSISPWSGEGLSAKAIGYSTAGWLVFTQIAAAAVGGFLAGRLRVKWAGVHTREVYFRDTAHGFLAWSVASLATAALLGTAVGAVISGGARTLGAAGSALGMTAAAAGAAQNPGEAANLADRMSGYFVDTLFRGNTGASAAASPNPAAPAPAAESAPLAAPATVPGPANAAPPEADISPAQRMEVTRIFAYSLRNNTLTAADKTYLGQIVARRTGMGQVDAEKRVADVFASYQRALDEAGAKAKQAADATRKAAAYGAMWMFLSLLCGAFVASLFATFGGRMRDRVELFGDGPVRRRENIAEPNLNA